MRLRYFVVILGILGSAAVLAGQDETKKQDPKDSKTVIIEGKKEPSLTVQSERKAAETLNQIPGATDLIPGEEVRQARAADLKDILQGTPGVYVSTRNGQEYRFSMRGSGLQRNFHLAGIKLLADGIPTNWADGFGDFNLIDPQAMEYMEVYKGANGFDFGSATLGGAVNFVSRTGRTAPAFDLRFEAGSWGYLNGQVAAGHVDGDFDVYASANHYSENGFRGHSRFSSEHLLANFGYRIAPEWETRVYVNMARTISELPDNLTFAQLHIDPRYSDPSPFGATAQDWHRDLDVIRVADKTTWKSGDQQVDFGAYWMFNDLFHPIFWIPELNLGVIDMRVNDFGGFARYTNAAKLGDLRNSLVVGACSSGNQILYQRFQNLGGRSGAMTADGITSSFNLLVYVQDQLWLTDDLSVVAGLQGMYTNRIFKDNFLTDIDGDQSFEVSYTGWNPMAGARYQLTPTSQVFFNVSRSFEPPQFIELLNVRFDPGQNGSILYNPLAAQRATTFEVGTRGKEGRLAWDLSYYYAMLNRELISNSPFPGAVGLNVVNNAHRTMHQGVELGLEVVALEGLIAAAQEKKDGDKVFVRTAYTWNDFHFQNDPAYGNNRQPAVPEHIIQVELGYSHPCGAFFSANIEIVPTRYPVDYSNTLYADSYSPIGLKAGYRPSEGFSAFIELRNLANERYANSVDQVSNAGGVDGTYFHPATGRSIYLGAELRW